MLVTMSRAVQTSCATGSLVGFGSETRKGVPCSAQLASGRGLVLTTSAACPDPSARLFIDSGDTTTRRR